MKYFQWQPGRCVATQDIQKFPIWSWLGFDVYLLKFPLGKKVATHLDPVEGKEHYRFNFTIKGCWILTKGEDTINQMRNSYHVFRPDITPHSAKFLTDCLVLSIGWTKKPK